MIYAVEVTTTAGPVISRFFTQIKNARKWAKRCAKTWPTRIMHGGQGGTVIQSFETDFREIASTL